MALLLCSYRYSKSYGVEVWFTEDNIWTMNDEDGELRLSIMATLVQNESKKISQRVKAGQMISFKNGILYGNGNILGYDRVGDKLVVNKTQAKAVKRIFELYLQGNGVRKIQNVMEQEHYVTSSGLTRWHASYINRVLRNPFYCGRIEYRKQFVPDYLTQKKVNNHGEVDKVYVQGEHEILISPEDFDLVQSIMDKKGIPSRDGITRGKTLAQNIWVKKLRCTCEHSMNRKRAYKSKVSGKESYSYQCYKQIRTGTPKHRANKGLSTEGICDNNTFSEWKLEVQAEFIFKKMLDNKQAIYESAMEMINGLEDTDFKRMDYKENIEKNIREIDKLKEKMAVLLDMCSEGDISREAFREKKSKIEQRIVELEKLNNSNRLAIEENREDMIFNNRMVAIKEFVKLEAFNKRKKIPDTIIDFYVDRIYYYRGKFQWFLNPKIGNKLTQIEADFGSKNLKKSKVISMLQESGDTGCYCKQVELSLN